MRITLVDIVLLGFLFATVWTDLLSRKIPNALIVVGLFFGVALGNSYGGLAGAGSSLAGAFIGLVVFLPFFAMRWMGAGDVKLLSMVGAFVGAPDILFVSVYTALAGGVLGLGSQILVRIGWIANSHIRSAIHQDSIHEGPATRVWKRFSAASFRLPYAVAIAGGAVIWMITRGA